VFERFRLWAVDDASMTPIPARLAAPQPAGSTIFRGRDRHRHRRNLQIEPTDAIASDQKEKSAERLPENCQPDATQHE
jgi:hypothetical protein